MRATASLCPNGVVNLCGCPRRVPCPAAVNLVELWARRWSDQSDQPIFDEFKHGVVVTERRYLDRQRHTYPFSLWHAYDSLQEYAPAH